MASTELAQENTSTQTLLDMYSYPFKYEDFPAAQIGSALNFELVELDGKYTFHKPGFNLQRHIDDRGGTVLEIAGPTEDGYQMLHGISLPTKPIITNIGSAFQYSEAGRFDQLTDLDKLHIDVIADGSRMPLADKSIDVLLASCLPFVQIKRLVGRPDSVLHEEIAVLSENIDRLVTGLKDGHTDTIDRLRESPRYGTLLEAARIVKDGGLFVYKGLHKEDIKLAAALGFDVVAHSPWAYYRHVGEWDVPHEVVFMKNNLSVEDVSHLFDEGLSAGRQ